MALAKAPPWETCSPPLLAYYTESRTVVAPPESRRTRKIERGVVPACVGPLEGCCRTYACQCLPLRVREKLNTKK